MNKKAVIYARVSSESDRQSTSRQVDDLTAYAYRNDLELVRVFEEKASGAECVKFCLAGEADTLLVTEISRLGRSVKIIVDTLDALTKAKVNVHIQDINLDTLQPSGEENPLASIIAVVMGQVAAIERQNIACRLASGRAIAKAKGVHFGRKPGAIIKTKEDKEQEYAKVLRELRHKTSIARTAKLCGVSESTVKRLKKEFGI